MAVREVKIGDSQKRDIKTALTLIKRWPTFTHGKRHTHYSDSDWENTGCRDSKTWTVCLAGI